MATKKNANAKNENVTAAAVSTDDSLEAKFARNAPNGGVLAEQEKYFQQNTSNRKEVAYAVNNNQLTVADLPADFDTFLLSSKKQAEFAAHHKTA